MPALGQVGARCQQPGKPGFIGPTIPPTPHMPAILQAPRAEWAGPVAEWDRARPLSCLAPSQQGEQTCKRRADRLWRLTDVSVPGRRPHLGRGQARTHARRICARTHALIMVRGVEPGSWAAGRPANMPVCYAQPISRLSILSARQATYPQPAPLSIISATGLPRPVGVQHRHGRTQPARWLKKWYRPPIRPIVKHAETLASHARAAPGSKLTRNLGNLHHHPPHPPRHLHPPPQACRPSCVHSNRPRCMFSQQHIAAWPPSSTGHTLHCAVLLLLQNPPAVRDRIHPHQKATLWLKE
ncbi:hypothetical protein DFH27DRAFT_268305 [Peziza echinospora]|nr:hypothetical protein DFH27DRAFT_268305 [Peziza echinospora]